MSIGQELSNTIPCDWCAGRGYIYISTKRCEGCNGTGRIKDYSAEAGAQPETTGKPDSENTKTPDSGRPADD